MACRPKKLLLILWISILWMSILAAAAGEGRLAAQPTAAAFPDPARRVITAEDIRHAGWTRLADLLTVLDDWTITSVDGFTYHARATGLPALDGPRWTLMIDGQPIRHAPFESPNLNAVAIPIEQIDSVEVVRTPGVHDGVFAHAGLLHLHTKQPAEGWSALGRLALGNQTGDPGPYRYTPFTSPNVDKIGPDYAFGVGWRRRTTYVRFNLPIKEDFATDVEIYRRIANVNVDFPLQQLSIAPSLQAAVEALGGRHTVLVSYAALKDQFFLPYISREIPSRRRAAQVGFNSRWPVAGRLGLSARGTYTDLRIHERGTTRDLRLDWEAGILDVHLEGTYTRRRARMSAGLRLERTEAVGPESIVYALGTGYGRIELVASSRVRQEITLGWTAGRDGGNGQAAWRGWWEVAPRHVLVATAGMNQVPLVRQNALLFWMREGYDGLSQGRAMELESPVSWSDGVASVRARYSYSTAEAAWIYRGPSSIRLEFSGTYRHIARGSLFRHTFVYEPADEGFGVLGREAQETEGGHFMGRMRFGTALGARRTLRLVYRLAAVVHGNAFFRDRQQAVPRHEGRIVFTAIPIPRVTFQALLSARSGTYWADYDRVFADSDGRYSADVPGFMSLDLAVHKQFWKEIGTFSVLVRDVFNRQPLAHPIGAPGVLRFFIRLGLRFNGG